MDEKLIIAFSRFEEGQKEVSLNQPLMPLVKGV